MTTLALTINGRAYGPIEVRDSLVNQCIPGDLVNVVGIVKTSQLDAPKVSRNFGGGGRGQISESGLHQLYVLGNSMVCIKSVCGAPVASMKVRSLKPAVSITKVSPSKRPTECPLKYG